MTMHIKLIFQVSITLMLLLIFLIFYYLMQVTIQGSRRVEMMRINKHLNDLLEVPIEPVIRLITKKVREAFNRPIQNI